MTVSCPKCKVKLSVPDDKATNPELKLKCPGCGLKFPLGKAPRQAPVARAAGATAATGVRPLTPGAAEPEGAAPVPASAASAGGEGGSAAWGRCCNHPQVLSEMICPNCGRGYCRDCGTRVKTSVICPPCDMACVKRVDWEERERRSARRARPMSAEIGVILSYPFTDLGAFAILGVLVAIFSLGSYGLTALFSFVLGTGLLMAYAFRTIEQVSDGDLRLSVPPLRDFGDIVGQCLLGLAAMFVSNLPLIAIFAILGASVLGGPATLLAGNPGGLARWLLTVGVFLLLGGLWRLFFTPVALAVAALSHSFWDTINPSIGLRTIQRMGSMYWQVMAIYVVLSIGQLVLAVPLSLIPIAGNVLAAIINVYVYLAMGCALGLAVDKKAEELGLDVLAA